MTNTIMEKEARETPELIAAQIKMNNDVVNKVAKHLRFIKPKMVMIIGRGSSDHAGVFAKYLIELESGIPTSSAAPSISSVYKKQLKLESALVIVISQSGRSPDIIAQARMAKAGGAYCVALVNEVNSPLIEIVDEVIPLGAGKEVAVAATKSFLATLSAIIHLVSVWTENRALYAALLELPNALTRVINSSTQLMPSDFAQTTNMIVLSRGLGFSIAKEIALKLKEVCSIYAEAFSSAEFPHGPITLAENGLTVLNCVVEDESKGFHRGQIHELMKRDTRIIYLDQADIDVHARLSPLLLLQRFYIDIAAVSIARGFHPDTPKGLNKVTQTL